MRQSESPTRADPPGQVARLVQDTERRALADRITEEALQLLYTAHQDLAEIQELGADSDPDLVQSAQECTLGAISILRVVASSVLQATDGPIQNGTSPDWRRSASVLFDALTDAWMVTCSDRDLLYISDAACTLLGRSEDDLRRLLRDKTQWPRELDRSIRTVNHEGHVELDVEAPMGDGVVRSIHVVAHPLPTVPGVKQSYISLLTER